MAPTAEPSPTQTELSVLGPLAEHRLLIVPQVGLLLGVSERTAVRRLRRLHDARLVHLEQIFTGQPAAAKITARGLRTIGSSLGAPYLNLNEYRHDVGVAWLWLAARAGSLGELSAFTSDRAMQAQDAAAVGSGGRARWGIGLGLFGRHGSPQHHYPDLMLDTTSGHRVAVELELTSKSTGRMDRIMLAYATDARIDHVLYLVGNPRIAQRVSTAAERARIGQRIHVKLLAADGIAGARAGGSRVTARPASTAVRAHGLQR